MTILAPNLPSGFEWDMRRATIFSDGVFLRSDWSMADDENKILVLRGEHQVMVSENSFHNPIDNHHWLRVGLANEQVGYVVSKFVEVNYSPPVGNVLEGVDDGQLYAIVDAWMARNVHLSDSVVADSTTAWLNQHGKRLIHEWLSSNMDEIVSKLSVG